jgi:hypothetical protein
MSIRLVSLRGVTNRVRSDEAICASPGLSRLPRASQRSGLAMTSLPGQSGEARLSFCAFHYVLFILIFEFFNLQSVVQGSVTLTLPSFGFAQDEFSRQGRGARGHSGFFILHSSISFVLRPLYFCIHSAFFNHQSAVWWPAYSQDARTPLPKASPLFF